MEIDPVLDREMSPSSMVGGSAAPFIARWQQRSEAAAVDLADRWQRTNGGTWLITPQAGHASVAFVHGGYWQQLGAADSLFAAATFVDRGWGFVAVEYPLAPEATIEQMVERVGDELAEVQDQLDGPTVVVGHSAGAQLVAMAAVADRLPAATERLVLISGIYDLVDVLPTSMNVLLRLDRVAAERLSPLRHDGLGTGPWSEVHITAGTLDTPRFVAHSTAYAAHLQRCGVPVRLTVRDGADHFSIVDSTLDELTRSDAGRR